MSSLNSLGAIFANIQKKPATVAPDPDHIQQEYVSPPLPVGEVSKATDFPFITQNETKIVMDFTTPDEDSPPVQFVPIQSPVTAAPRPQQVVQELSASTLQSYSKKASDSEEKVGLQGAHAVARGNTEQASKLAQKETNRRVGIGRARQKIMKKEEKETPEQRRTRIIENALNKAPTLKQKPINELSNEKIDSYKKKASGIPSSDNDLIKRYRGAGLAAKKVKTVDNTPKAPDKPHEEYDPMKNLADFLRKARI